jgi:uncharacterized protein YdeI (YjbR/CyaY-like superfamily)
MAIYFFETAAAFRAWLEKNHQTETELLVGFYKVGSKKASMTWSESVDEALCFGWIDGVRKSIDTDSYQIRFTPRKPTSIWSAVNIEKVEILTKSGRMQAAGLASFAHRVEQKSKIYTYEKDEIILASQYEAELKSNSKAWAYFELLAPSYKKSSIHWVMSAKQEATQIKRLKTLIADCEAGINQWKN